MAEGKKRSEFHTSDGRIDADKAFGYVIERLKHMTPEEFRAVRDAPMPKYNKPASAAKPKKSAAKVTSPAASSFKGKEVSVQPKGAKAVTSTGSTAKKTAANSIAKALPAGKTSSAGLKKDRSKIKKPGV